MRLLPTWRLARGLAALVLAFAAAPSAAVDDPFAVHARVPAVAAGATASVAEARCGEPRGVGLYAFVEAPGASERAIQDFVAADPNAVKAPERLQVVDALPRSAAGAVRNEILQLVAMNQIDLIDQLIGSETERATVARIVADRRNLRDRTAF